jgi:drug/metabolite transporter (DMT)-like permease
LTPHSRLLPKLAILLNPALAGSYYVVVGAALDWVDPGSFLALEAMFLLPVALAVWYWQRSALTFETIASGLLLGLILFGNMQISIWSIAFTSVSNAGFYPALIGPITVLATWLVFNTSLSPRHIGVSLLAFAGAAALVSSGFNAEGNWRGDALALVATVVFVPYILLLERVSAQSGKATVLWASQMIGVSTLALLVYRIFGTTPAAVLLSEKALTVGAYSAVFTTMLPVFLATYAQRYLSAIFVSFAYLLEPLWAAGLAFIFLGERMSGLQLVGGALVITASFLMWFGDYKDANPATDPG